LRSRIDKADCIDGCVKIREILQKLERADFCTAGPNYVTGQEQRADDVQFDKDYEDDEF